MSYFNGYELKIDIRLTRVYDGRHMSASESIGFNSLYTLSATSFTEVANILAQFEALADSLRQEPAEQDLPV
jgi:hypothetical protein